MPYRLVIFDLDGTLCDSFPWFLGILGSVAERHGFRRIDAHEAEALRGAGPREILRRLRVPIWKLPTIARDMRRLKADQLDRIALFPGVDRLLQSLAAQGTVLAMVSSDDEANVRRALGAANARLISHFACGASLFGKAAKFRRVLKASGMAANEALCIGDEIRDLDAARKAGLAFGAVTWGFATEAALRRHGPDAVFSDFDDMIVQLQARPAPISATPAGRIA